MSMKLNGLSSSLLNRLTSTLGKITSGDEKVVKKALAELKKITDSFESKKSDHAHKAHKSLKHPKTHKTHHTHHAHGGGNGSGGVSSSSSASTAAPSATGAAIDRDVQGAFGSGGYGLTKDQEQMLRDAGLKPGSQEWKQQELQLKIANYSNMMQTLSNVGKMLTDLSNRIIGNIRA